MEKTAFPMGAFHVMAIKNYQAEIMRLQKECHFDFVALALVQRFSSNELRWCCAVGNRSERYRLLTLYSGKGVAGLVFKTGKSLLIENVANTLLAEGLHNYPIVGSEGLKSFGALPLFDDGRVVGVLLVGYRTANRLTEQSFQQFQAELMGAFVDLQLE